MDRCSVGRGTIVLVGSPLVDAAADVLVTEAAFDGPGELHAAAGPRLVAALRAIPRWPVGAAVMTPAYDLSARGVRWITHAAVPSWADGAEGPLARAYASAFRRVEEVALGRVAVGPLGLARGGFPVDRAAEVGVAAARAHLGRAVGSLVEVRFALPDEAVLEAFRVALGAG